MVRVGVLGSEAWLLRGVDREARGRIMLTILEHVTRGLVVVGLVEGGGGSVQVVTAVGSPTLGRGHPIRHGPDLCLVGLYWVLSPLLRIVLSLLKTLVAPTHE